MHTCCHRRRGRRFSRTAAAITGHNIDADPGTTPFCWILEPLGAYIKGTIPRLQEKTVSEAVNGGHQVLTARMCKVVVAIRDEDILICLNAIQEGEVDSFAYGPTLAANRVRFTGIDFITPCMLCRDPLQHHHRRGSDLDEEPHDGESVRLEPHLPTAVLKVCAPDVCGAYPGPRLF